jgi:hypothetical protein
MDVILLNLKKGTLEEQLQSFENIKEERNLLKLNQEEDVKYWALKKHVDDFEIYNFAT